MRIKDIVMWIIAIICIVFCVTYLMMEYHDNVALYEYTDTDYYTVDEQTPTLWSIAEDCKLPQQDTRQVVDEIEALNHSNGYVQYGDVVIVPRYE